MHLFVRLRCLLIGLIETFFSGYFSIAYKDVATFGILVMVLVSYNDIARHLSP